MNNHLENRIERLKKKMIQSGKENGLNHPLTVKLSQDLDKLINKQMKTMLKK